MKRYSQHAKAHSKVNTQLDHDLHEQIAKYEAEKIKIEEIEKRNKAFAASFLTGCSVLAVHPCEAGSR